MTMPDWLTVTQGAAPLIVSLPHTGTVLPPEVEARVASPWLARKDADWWIDRLYAFAADLDATIIHTAISRTAIDVNRDPSGVSLYPGQTTTGLCPTETFDGEPLYAASDSPTPRDMAERRRRYLRAVSRGARGAGRPAHGAASAHRALRLPLDPFGGAAGSSTASCRSSTSARMTARAATGR